MVFKMKKRVLLYNPVLRRYSQPRLGLAYVASALKSAGNEVSLAMAPGGSIKEIEGQIASFKPDYLGVTGFTSEYYFILEIFKAAKRANHSIKTVFGGPHASSVAGYILSSAPEVDYVIRGEAEESMPQLVSGAVKPDDIAGLCYRKDGKPVIKDPAIIKDLDSLTYPWDVITPAAFDTGQVHGYMYRNRPVIPVLSSRGCPYLCTYCAGHSVFGHKIRLRDPLKFVDELEYLNKTFKVKEFQIIDDNFSFFREHAIAVCNEILSRKLEINWTLPNGIRADKLDEELLGLMKKSGCYYMAFGFEFGSKRILKEMKKSLDSEKSRRTVITADKMGFITHGFFLMGYPTEEKEDIEATKDLILSLPLDRISIGTPIPYPGSELFDYYRDKKVFKDLDSFDWDYYSEGNSKLVFEHLEYPYVKSMVQKTYRKFYFNPLRMLRFILKFRTLTQFAAFFSSLKGGITLINNIMKQKEVRGQK
jgi:radical SAM superfamily enzyme YgiQ (UPF0313 family)